MEIDGSLYTQRETETETEGQRERKSATKLGIERIDNSSGQGVPLSLDGILPDGVSDEAAEGEDQPWLAVFSVQENPKPFLQLGLGTSQSLTSRPSRSPRSLP